MINTSETTMPYENKKFNNMLEKYHMTINDVAYLTGVPYQTLNHWKKGNKIPKDYVLNLLDFKLKSLEGRYMKRYLVKTNAYNMVVFVDRKNLAFVIDEKRIEFATNEDSDIGLTLETAKRADYSVLDCCKTARDCCYAIGLCNIKDYVFKFEDIINDKDCAEKIEYFEF